MDQGKGLRVLSVISYVLAGVVLLLGMIMMISLAGAATNLPNMLIGFQVLGLGPVLDAFIRPVQGALTTAGVIILVVALVLTLLLYAVGRLVGVIRSLVQRVNRLEAAYRMTSPAPPEPQSKKI